MTTRIHLDGIVFSLQAHGGISVVFREWLSRLPGSALDVTMTMETPCLQDDLLSPGAGHAVQVRGARRLERYRRCRPLVGVPSPEVFHSTYYRVPADRGVASVVTVHDFAYERTVKGPRTWIHSAQKRQALREAQALVCVSEATRDDLLELVGLRTGQQLHVVHNGVSPTYRPMSANALDRSARPYLLFVGQRGRYKNFRLAVDALSLLPEHELLCVGGGALSAPELAHASDSVRARIRHLGAVGNEELNRLYNGAHCLVYPSAYEGFGIPVAEAMAAGCPVVGIDCRAVRELGGEALTVADANGPGIAAAVRDLAEPARRAQLTALGRLRAAAFSWDTAFAQMAAIYRGLVTR